MSVLGYFDHIDAARQAISKGDPARGRKHFQAAIDIRPDSAEAYYGMGTACYLGKDLSAARDCFEKVRELDPSHAGAHINLGALLNLQGKHEEAIPLIRRGIQLDTKRAEGYYNLGHAYRKLGKHELAVQAYREAHHLSPRMVEALFHLGLCYHDMDRLEQAAAHFKQAVEINPGYRRAHEALDQVNQTLKQRKKSTGDSGILNAIEDTSELDISLDGTVLERTLDPDHDHDALANLHQICGEVNKHSAEWVKLIEEVHATLRNVGVHLASDSGPEAVAESARGFHLNRLNLERNSAALRKSFEDTQAALKRLAAN